MTNDEILQAAKEAGCNDEFIKMAPCWLERFAAIIEKRTIERCAGCSPDNCSGCGAAPVGYIFKPNNELLWPNEVDQNVFASDPEDYDLLYVLRFCGEAGVAGEVMR